MSNMLTIWTKWGLFDDGIKEINDRGFALLEELGWASDPGAIYKNRYTGTEETLLEVCEGNIGGWLFSALDNWYPVDLWEDSQLFDKYNPKLDKEDSRQFMLFAV